MRILSRRSILGGFVIFLGTVLSGGPVAAVEDGLLGVRIGASYRELAERFGQPHGILFPSGGGLLFQTVSMAAQQGGLPQFGAQTTTTPETPVWVLPVRASVLTEKQTQWVYDLRKTRGVALGIMLSGEGADAVVTDVVVAGFPVYLKGKPEPVRTQKGITLQSSFREVLKRYGYPPVIEIYAPSGISAAGVGAAPRAGGLRAGTGMGRRGMTSGAMRAGGRGGPGGMGMGGGGMRGGRGPRGEAPSPSIRLAETDRSGLEVVLTQGPGGPMAMPGPLGGPGMGGGMRGGGMGGGTRGGAGGRSRRGMQVPRTRGALSPLTVGGAPGAAADRFTATAVVEHQQISFSRDCILIYEGIAFTLHDMKVFRIHVSE